MSSWRSTLKICRTKQSKFFVFFTKQPNIQNLQVQKPDRETPSPPRNRRVSAWTTVPRWILSGRTDVLPPAFSFLESGYTQPLQIPSYSWLTVENPAEWPTTAAFGMKSSAEGNCSAKCLQCVLIGSSGTAIFILSLGWLLWRPILNFGLICWQALQLPWALLLFSVVFWHWKSNFELNNCHFFISLGDLRRLQDLGAFGKSERNWTSKINHWGILIKFFSNWFIKICLIATTCSIIVGSFWK